MFERIHDRTDLIALVARKVNIPACKRACVTGRVEVLGGFGAIPPSLLPGWMLTITAKHGTVFQVAVIPDEINHLYRVRLADEIPWHLWVGKPLAGAHYSIYQGDWPARYDMKRELARKKLHYDPTDPLVFGCV